MILYYLFADYRARIERVYLEPPLATIFAQNDRRSKRVPAKVMHRLIEKLEPPSVTEGHALVMVERCPV